MDDLDNMTEEKQGRLNDILQNAIRWLAAQADAEELDSDVAEASAAEQRRHPPRRVRPPIIPGANEL